MQSQVEMIIMSPAKLEELIDAAVRKALEAPMDRPVTRLEAAAILGKHPNTIARMQQRGELKPLNDCGHHTYSFLEVMGQKSRLFTRAVK